MLTLMHNQGPPDLEEWLKKFFRKVVPQKRASLNDLLPPDQQKSSGFGTWLAIPFFVLAGLGMSGIITVKPDENVVLERFGVYQATLGSGMHWIIPFVDRPISVELDAQSASISGLMLTEDHALVNANISVNYVVTDPKAFVFASQNVALVLQTYLRATSVETLSGENISDLLDQDNWDVLASTLQQNFNLSANNYGIQIQNITVNSIAVPDALSNSFNQKISAAQAQVNTLMASAQQYKDAVVPLATQRASQLQNDANAARVSVLVAAKANVAQFNALLPLYQEDPQAVAAYLPLAVSSARVNHDQDNSAVGSSVNTTDVQSNYLRWQGANQAQASGGGNS